MLSVDLKNSIKIASILIGTIVGAGFASGQEILQFFTVFHRNGAIGIVLTGIIFFLISIAVLEHVYRYKSKNYEEFIVAVAGKYAGSLIEFIVMLFLLFSFIIMVAGAGALFKEHFGVPTILGSTIMSVACFIIFLFNFRGLVAISTVMAPILVVGIGLLGLYICTMSNVTTYNGKGIELVGNWFSSSVIYASYNSITLIAILASLLPYLSSRKVAVVGSLLGSGLLSLLAVIIYALTSIFYSAVLECEIPILQVIEKLNLSVGSLYSFILLTAMFSSAASVGFCFLNKVSRGLTRKFSLYAIILCSLAIPLSQIGFANLVKCIYPIFGYIGLFQLLLVILAYVFRFKPRATGRA